MSKEMFVLSRKKIYWLIRYYIILFFIGLMFTFFSLLHESFTSSFIMPITLVSIIGGFGTALIGSSIFYLRKIYKASINLQISPPINEGDDIRELGIYSYYYLRPLFSIGFSILIHVTLKSSVSIITVKEAQLDEGFIYLTMFLSFFGGFAAGDLITYIETRSSDWVTKTFKN